MTEQLRREIIITPDNRAFYEACFDALHPYAVDDKVLIITPRRFSATTYLQTLAACLLKTQRNITVTCIVSFPEDVTIMMENVKTIVNDGSRAELSGNCLDYEFPGGIDNSIFRGYEKSQNLKGICGDVTLVDNAFDEKFVRTVLMPTARNTTVIAVANEIPPYMVEWTKVDLRKPLPTDWMMGPNDALNVYRYCQANNTTLENIREVVEYKRLEKFETLWDELGDHGYLMISIGPETCIKEVARRLWPTRPDDSVEFRDFIRMVVECVGERITYPDPASFTFEQIANH